MKKRYFLCRTVWILALLIVPIAAEATTMRMELRHWANAGEYRRLKYAGLDFVVTMVAADKPSSLATTISAAQSAGMKLVIGAYPPPYALNGNGAWTITPNGIQFLSYLRTHSSPVMAVFVFNEPYWKDPFTHQSNSCGAMTAAQLRSLRITIRSVWPDAKVYDDVGSPAAWTTRGLHATGNVTAVTGPNSPIGGGLAGENQGTVETSWATGSVTGSDDSSEVGGLIGSLDSGTLKNAYATGTVKAGTDALVGGAVGYAGAGISASYSTGAPSGSEPGLVGGFVGYDDSAGGMKHDYWDLTTSGVTDPGQGAGNIANDPGIKGQTTRKLKSQLPNGFSAKVWAEDVNLNGGLPYLRKNLPAK